MRFSVLTYNQEDLILYTLESIRWQIEQYGDFQTDEIIIYDDCSNDATVDVCQKWFSYYGLNGASFRVEKSDLNQGIVKNYLRAAITGKRIPNKIIAGDDLFSQENIYEVVEADKFIISSVATFIGDTVRNEFPLQLMELYKAKLDNQLSNVFEKKWELGNFLVAPGVFYPIDMFSDQELIKEMSKNKWVEDQAIWDYEFIHLKKASQIHLSNKCYVLYRGSGGISTSFKLFKMSPYQEEANRVETLYHLKRGNIISRNLRLLAHNYFQKLRLALLCKKEKEMAIFLEEHMQSCAGAQEHLLQIIENVTVYKTLN